MVEILCGVLTGAVELGSVKPLVDLSGPSGTGHSFCAIDISSFAPVSEFKRRVDSMISRVKAVRRAPGIEKIYLPGEIELEAEKIREKNGIPLSEEVLHDLEDIGRKYNIKGPCKES